MITESIVESGMTFGPFPEGQCFCIEKSRTYAQVREGVPMAEFLVLKQQKEGSVVWVVEAKSSSPKPDGKAKFDAFIEEISRKLTHGFLLYLAMRLGRHAKGGESLPDAFQSLNSKATGFRFVLVINGHQQDWLPPLQDALSSALKSVVKTWALLPTSVVVLNEVLAKQQGLIG